ncbi:unnamed protein product [Blumeria hordei]|uniref:Uncharacterized protein n=1 Tax=Blumeria hordei TaxID=2867405 RepID=A0A383UU81_BLUHO|nr:unnamed protein product [Blumeria hordei]
MLNPSALLSISITLLIHISSVLASTPELQAREIEAHGHGFNCGNFIFTRKDINLHMKDGCTALRYSPEFNVFPSFFEKSYLFPEYSDSVLFSWPVYFGSKRFQTGPTGYNRIVFTHLCELVGLVIVIPPKFNFDGEALTVCRQYEDVASQPGSSLDISDIKDELDRVNCSDQIMITKEFIMDATKRACSIKNLKYRATWKHAPRNLFASNELLIVPIPLLRKFTRKGLHIDTFIVVNTSCELQAVIYSDRDGDDYNFQHCTKAKILESPQHDADDHFSHQDVDEYDGSLLRESKKFKCHGIILDSRMIRDNLRAAKHYFRQNLSEINKITKESNKKERNYLPYPQKTLEGHIWLWPLRVPGSLFASMGKRKDQVYFLIGLNESNELTGVYHSIARNKRRRSFGRCIGAHETKNGSHRKVSLGPVYHNSIGA